MAEDYFDWEKVVRIIEDNSNMFGIGCYTMPKEEPLTITEVVFFGKTDCNVYWSDGEFTSVTCGKKDTFSEETAILMAIAKRFMKGYTTVEKALQIAKRLPSKGRLKKLMAD